MSCTWVRVSPEPHDYSFTALMGLTTCTRGGCWLNVNLRPISFPSVFQSLDLVLPIQRTWRSWVFEWNTCIHPSNKGFNQHPLSLFIACVYSVYTIQYDVWKGLQKIDTSFKLKIQRGRFSLRPDQCQTNVYDITNKIFILNGTWL